MKHSSFNELPPVFTCKDCKDVQCVDLTLFGEEVYFQYNKKTNIPLDIVEGETQNCSRKIQKVIAV